MNNEDPNEPVVNPEMEGDESKKTTEGADDEFKDDGAEPEGTTTTKKDDEDESEEDLEEEISPTDEKFITKIVDKRLSPLANTLTSTRIETELQNIFANNPEYKTYEARIRRFVTHQNRIELIKQGLPVKTVVIEALEPYLQKIGAEKSRLADEKANRSRVEGGSSVPQEGTLPDVSKMSSMDIQQMAEQIKAGRYKTGT